MELSWGIDEGKSVDLDASAVITEKDGDIKGCASYQSTRIGNYIQHMGDNVCGFPFNCFYCPPLILFDRF